MIGRSVLVLKRLSFLHLLIAAFALTFVVGFAAFVLSGATTNRGTTSAIRTERATIMSAEKARCQKYGTYTSTATLRREGFLTFTPAYNSVVYLAGKNCGTIVIGSPSYQSPTN
jgi:hypothetical protein